MNALDFILILIIALALFIKRRSAAQTFLAITFGLVGYAIGLLLLSFLAKKFGLGLWQGVLYLAVVVTVYIAGLMVGEKAGSRIKTKILLSSFSDLDKKLLRPTQIVLIPILLIIFSQSLPYIPFTHFQYQAQGSFLLFTTRKVSPGLVIQDFASKIYPQQFTNHEHLNDRRNLTFDNISKAAEVNESINEVASSVVQVINKGCMLDGANYGSAFFISPNYLVTNAHVVRQGINVFIKDHKGSYPASTVYINDKLDTAILYSMYVEGQPLELANGHPATGEEVFVLGYPGGGDLKISLGEVIEVNLLGFTERSDLELDNTVQVDAISRPGNSGGPLFAIDGEVIGVVNSVSSGAKRETNAVSSDTLSPIIDQALSRYYTTRAGFCKSFGGL